MKKLLIVLAVICISLPFLFAESVGATSLNLHGAVAPKSIFALAGYFEIVPDAIRLDEGAILPSAGGNGVDVGQWSVSSNSSSSLIIRLRHPEAYATMSGTNGIGVFTAIVEEELVQIPYRVSNGTDWVYDGDVFKTLVRDGGTYKSDVNNGPVYMQRIDEVDYPPYSAYQTTIQLILEAL
ncbi:MAG: hypothetical protein WC182_05755 [Bacilli bacterium]